jgi:hypothetical protein
MYGDSTRCPTCGDYVTPGARGAFGPSVVGLGRLIALGVGVAGALIAAALR